MNRSDARRVARAARASANARAFEREPSNQKNERARTWREYLSEGARLGAPFPLLDEARAELMKAAKARAVLMKCEGASDEEAREFITAASARYSPAVLLNEFERTRAFIERAEERAYFARTASITHDDDGFLTLITDEPLERAREERERNASEIRRLYRFAIRTARTRKTARLFARGERALLRVAAAENGEKKEV